jgi:rod shape-determining protein MreC
MGSVMRNSKGVRRLVAVLGLLAVIFALMALTARPRTNVTPFEKGIATLLYPFQVATDWVADRVKGVTASIQELTHLREENARLRAAVEAGAQDKALAERLTQENRTLQAELQMKQRSSYPLLTAQVISRTSDTWYRTVVINRGSQDGVQPSMAVVNWQGMVGKVLSTTPFTATVQLMLDGGFSQQGFAAGAKVPSGDLGVIETVQGGEVRMVFIMSSPTVKVGQPVFTSGQGILPPNLLIGYVENEPTGSGLPKTVTIKPAVDFNKLDVLHVVMFTATAERGGS